MGFSNRNGLLEHLSLVLFAHLFFFFQGYIEGLHVSNGHLVSSVLFTKQDL